MFKSKINFSKDKLSSKKLKIQSFISTSLDWFSLNQIYVAVVGERAIRLYINLYFQKQINDQLEINSYNLERFLKNHNLNESDFHNLLSELEKFDLAKLYVQSNVNSEIEFTVKIEEIKSLKIALKNEKIRGKLQENLTREKLSELQLLIEDADYGCAVNLNDSINLPNQKEEYPENILDEETYCNFYNGIFRNLNSEFSLCDDVLKMVRDYYLIDNRISLEKLQHFSYLSIKDIHGKLIVSPENLSFLINQEVNKSKNKPFDEEKYDNFWKELLIMQNKEIKSKFDELFSEYESEKMYKLLTDKSKVPATLNKWIKDCIQNKHLSFPIVNASISFVKTLLNKIPINYLIKLTDTLISKRIFEEEEFINHIKQVIIHDSENQNRMNAKTEMKNEINSIKIADEEPYFFSKKTSF